MTGFAVLTRELPQGTLNLELRSVNHRYLDVQFRLPDEIKPFEPQLRELIAARVQRGKLECRISLAQSPQMAGAPQLDTTLLARLADLDRQIRERIPDAHSLSVGDVLRWPGMLGSESVSADELRAACLGLATAVLDEFTASRRREGAKLAQLLLDRVTRMEQLVAVVQPKIPLIAAAFQEKLGQRLRDAMVAGDDDRLRQELVLFAAKIDVEEELGRLSTHIAEIRRILAAGGAAGKRLDFLMQELNREANTLGSKSVDVEVSQVSMELKVLIEQMREQVQNIE